MEFEIKCHLGYEVSGPAAFLFNVAVAQNSFQRIITEHFDLAGADSRQEMVIGGQRYHRVTAQSGSVEQYTKQWWTPHTKCSEILPGFKCRSSNKFLPKPWFLFTRAVFVGQIYSPDLRNASSAKTSLGSTALRGYVIGFSNELSICPGQRLKGPQHSTRLRN